MGSSEATTSWGSMTCSGAAARAALLPKNRERGTGALTASVSPPFAVSETFARFRSGSSPSASVPAAAVAARRAAPPASSISVAASAFSCSLSCSLSCSRSRIPCGRKSTGTSSGNSDASLEAMGPSSDVRTFITWSPLSVFLATKADFPLDLLARSASVRCSERALSVAKQMKAWATRWRAATASLLNRTPGTLLRAMRLIAAAGKEN
mmetsp:Transcript_65226/g.170840  ORF Transcript_65226/g.170840 Transcript_65226/m.170840 type:complete len:209 (+) Transcript_65226:60-686(+)